jgi:hypothetical protein
LCVQKKFNDYKDLYFWHSNCFVFLALTISLINGLELVSCHLQIIVLFLKAKIMFKKIFLTGATVLAVAATGSASAHTISLGTYNAGASGSVTLAMGTYDHGSHLAQGAMTLVAGPGGFVPVLSNFSSYTNTKPLALVDGVNNFYGDTGTNYGSLPSDSFHTATNNLGLGPVVDWQEVTFTGLTAGLYTYQLSGMFSQNWTNINSFQDNWRGTILITDSVVTGSVPEPASLTLFGLALFGFVAARRRAA